MEYIIPVWYIIFVSMAMVAGAIAVASVAFFVIRYWKNERDRTGNTHFDTVEGRK